MKYSFHCFYFTIQSWLDSIKKIFVKKELPGPVVVDNINNYIDFTELRKNKYVKKDKNIIGNSNTNKLIDSKGLQKSSNSLYYSCTE
jgi:hypothetical protein